MDRELTEAIKEAGYCIIPLPETGLPTIKHPAGLYCPECGCGSIFACSDDESSGWICACCKFGLDDFSYEETEFELSNGGEIYDRE